MESYEFDQSLAFVERLFNNAHYSALQVFFSFSELAEFHYPLIPAAQGRSQKKDNFSLQILKSSERERVGIQNHQFFVNEMLKKVIKK
jgi:hypothetical protein